TLVTGLPFSVQAGVSESSLSPGHTTLLGTFATTTRNADGYVAPTSSASSPPRDVPISPTRAVSTKGCDFSHSTAVAKYSSGTFCRSGGNPSALKYASASTT